MDDIGIDPGDDSRVLGGFWTLVERISRLQNLQSWKIAPPLLSALTGQLVSREEWKTAEYNSKIKEFVESRGLGRVYR